MIYMYSLEKLALVIGLSIEGMQFESNKKLKWAKEDVCGIYECVWYSMRRFVLTNSVVDPSVFLVPCSLWTGLLCPGTYLFVKHLCVQ